MGGRGILPKFLEGENNSLSLAGIGSTLFLTSRTHGTILVAFARRRQSHKSGRQPLEQFHFSSVLYCSDAFADLLYYFIDQLNQCACRLSYFVVVVVVVRPHRSTTYVDAAYCYRRRSVVCLSVRVRWAQRSMHYTGIQIPLRKLQGQFRGERGRHELCKTAKPIDMPFGHGVTRVGTRKHVLDGGCTLAPPGE